eukprot:scaffold23941_cov42-Cyclotella_meneghiniana.AAC.1
MSYSSGRRPTQAPKGYIPGLGRGAAGFVTASDIGPAAARPADNTEGAESSSSSSFVGSRSAELRAAKLSAQKQQQQQQQLRFGVAPAGYVAGAGRGASTYGVDQGSSNGDTTNTAAVPMGGPSEMETSLFARDGQFDDDDDDDDLEADKIYAAIDERMSNKRKRNNNNNNIDNQYSNTNHQSGETSSSIGDQFRQLKSKLAEVTEEQWAAIPDVGDYSLRHKQKRREDVFTPLSDSLLESRSMLSNDATAGGRVSGIAGTTMVSGSFGVDNNTLSSGFKTNLSGLAEARSTVMSMTLDKMSDSISGQTVVDPKGYLTSLSSVKIASAAEVGDVNKARLLLKSVRDTNPKHAPGWIAAARVEEAAGKTVQARKLIVEGCEICPDNEDVWLEAARLHQANDQAKTILAAASRRIPHSVKIWCRASDLESNDADKKAVLRKALEMNPNSVTLWKAAIDLEDEDDAKVLLSVAVEKVPHSVEMWLALARLETYDNARKVLNRARKELPSDRSVWIAAAKLEESQNHGEMVDRIIEKAVRSLDKHEAVVARSQWLQEAETAESAGAPLTSAAIVKCTVGRGVDDEDRQRTWSDDANAALSRGAIATSRAILAHSLATFPSKRSLWLQAVDLERSHGTPSSLDEVLAAASERLPRQEIFWLVRAKEKWMAGDVNASRNILTEAFKANPESEPVWLAAIKLEWENGEIERAEKLLERARERAPTARIYMKSAQFERERQNLNAALNLLEEGISKYPKFAKLYMMGGQCSQQLSKERTSLDRARKFYQQGLQQCPENVVLWILASRLEEHVAEYGAGSTNAGLTKARSILELARLKNPKNDQLWVEAIRLERRAGNDKLAVSLMAKALKECPDSGFLLSENIITAPRVEQKSKSADAIKKCPDDPRVIAAVAALFAGERKNDKARKWFERATAVDSDNGDSWAKLYAFELDAGTKEAQDNVKQRCVSAEPKHGELWCEVAKSVSNRGKSIAEVLEIVSSKILEKLHQ